MTTRTIDLTPTWSGVLRILLAAYQNGTAKGQSMAEAELIRMAQLADLYVAEHRIDENKQRDTPKPPVQVAYATPATRVEMAVEYITAYSDALDVAELAPNGDDFSRLASGLDAILRVGMPAAKIDLDEGAR